MGYTINCLIAGASFDEVDARTRKALADNGFGVLTEIDVQATMKKKLYADMPAHRILGACNPNMAHQAINALTLKLDHSMGPVTPWRRTLKPRGNR